MTAPERDEPGEAGEEARLRAAVAALQGQVDRLRRERDAAVRTADEAERRLATVYGTSTWKAGRGITWLPRTLKDAARASPRLRRLLGRPAGPRGAGPAAGSRAATLRLEPRADVRAAYERALARREFSGAGRGVVMAVSTTDLDEGRGDVYTAVGLGRCLEASGYEVVYRPPEGWYDLPAGTDLHVSLVAERDLMVDPLRLPPGCRRLAWVRNATERWASSPGLPFYDAVLCSSASSLRALRRSFSGPAGLLRIAVDDELFAEGGGTDRRTVVATVNAWGRERDLHRALRHVGVDFPLALYGRQHPALGDLLAHAAGTVSFFALPSVYAQAAVVLDDVQDVNQRHGNVNARVFESLACGALPLTNSAAGLAEVGLGDVPSYDEPEALDGLVHRWLGSSEERAELVERLRAVVAARHTYRRRAEEFSGFVAAHLDAPGRGGPAAAPARAEVVVGFYPDYRSTNPYQRMLYARAASHGVTAVPAGEPVRVATSGALRGRPFVFHVHWTAPVLGPATSRRDADQRRAAFVDRLDALRDHGARIVWTVHNVLPHECVHPDVERRLRAELAARADAVHVMCAETPSLVAEHYELPADRVAVIGHGSYVDVYPNVVAPAQARLELGLDPDHVVLLFLGGIRPYKGLDDLLDAFDLVSRERPDYRLVVAGRPGNFHGVDALRRRCEEHPAVVAYFEPVADSDLQVFFRAADVAVLPHRQVLNSGGLQLAWSFGRPAIVPRAGCLSGQVTPDVGATFEGQAGLVAALREAAALRTPAVRRASFERAASYPYTAMSEEFMALVTRLARS